MANKVNLSGSREAKYVHDRVHEHVRVKDRVFRKHLRSGRTSPRRCAPVPGFLTVSCTYAEAAEPFQVSPEEGVVYRECN
jgi:hypothetical protein